MGKRYLNYSLASVPGTRTAGIAVGSARSAERVHQSQAESRGDIVIKEEFHGNTSVSRTLHKASIR